MGPFVYLTRQSQFTLAIGLQFFQNQHGGSQWNLLMAASALVILPIVVLFFFAQFVLFGFFYDKLHILFIILMMIKKPECSCRNSIINSGSGIRYAVFGNMLGKTIDAFEQFWRHPIDPPDGQETLGFSLKYVGFGTRKVRCLGLDWAKPLQRPGDPFDKSDNRFLKLHAGPLQRRPSSV